MTTKRSAAIVAAAALALGTLAGCNSTQNVEATCADPAEAAFAALDSASAHTTDAGSTSGGNTNTSARSSSDTESLISQTEVQAQVNAQELARCAAEAMGALKGYQQNYSVNGTRHSSARVNVQPLQVDQTLATKQANGLEEFIMLEGFVFAKVNGRWIEVTEDNDDPTINALLNLPQSFQTQFNPNLRAAGTDSSISYSLIGTSTVLGKPVIVLEALLGGASTSTNESKNDSASASTEAGSTTGAYTSRYYVTKDYVILRSETQTADGTISVSEITELDTAQTIKNPILEEYDSTK